MKLSCLSALLVSTVVLSACDHALAPDQGRLVARWSGYDWSGTASAMLKKGRAADTLYLYANGSPVSMQREQEISAIVPVTGVGTYKLGPWAAAFYETVGGDVLTASYTTTADATGTLTITKFEGIGGAIEGSISFSAVSDARTPLYGKTINFNDGRFRTTIKEFPLR